MVEARGYGCRTKRRRFGKRGAVELFSNAIRRQLLWFSSPRREEEERDCRVQGSQMELWPWALLKFSPIGFQTCFFSLGPLRIWKSNFVPHRNSHQILHVYKNMFGSGAVVFVERRDDLASPCQGREQPTGPPANTPG
ncbi:hypothetical protein TorRG33x02_153240 [Trema orientale]|uniref:Uncharacterized protein n=1 Tax=Trema orientale TaxID=63057 RepID=A0A2P5ETR1_TREOI|nr:hypothetical protein TorRG33x02_153240 [Trema orientale]